MRRLRNVVLGTDNDEWPTFDRDLRISGWVILYSGLAVLVSLVGLVVSFAVAGALGQLS